MAKGEGLCALADIYGPSEGIIGKYLQSSPGARDRVQVLTKFCCFGQSMDFADNPKYVRRVPDSASCTDSLIFLQYMHLWYSLACCLLPFEIPCQTAFKSRALAPTSPGVCRWKYIVSMGDCRSIVLWADPQGE